MEALLSQPAFKKPAATAVSSALLVAELVGSLLLWAPLPLAWFWIGGRVYTATGSLGADIGVILVGFLVTTIAAVVALSRLDRAWVRARRCAGHDQVQGALPQVVVISATLGILAFLVWYVVLKQAFVMPFMPTG